MVAMAGVIYAFTTVYFRRRNKSRAAGDDDHTVVGMSEEEIAELGDENPRFVYTE